MRLNACVLFGCDFHARVGESSDRSGSRAVENPQSGLTGTARQLRTRLRHSNNVQAGEKPYLIVHVGLNRAVLLVAAGICVKFGSGGRICHTPTVSSGLNSEGIRSVMV